eukprot:1474269-Alexandrium_andersonii.AAC.1
MTSVAGVIAQTPARAEPLAHRAMNKLLRVPEHHGCKYDRSHPENEPPTIHRAAVALSLIHISEPTRLALI